MFLGDTPIDFYYLGEQQISYEPKSVSTIPTNGLIYLFDATNVDSYPGSGSIWYDLSPNKLWASTFSSSVFPTYDVTNKEFDFNGSNNALMAAITSSVATGSKISNFTQIMWVKLNGNQTGSAIGMCNIQSSKIYYQPAPTADFDAISFNDDSNNWRLIGTYGERSVSSSFVETVFNDYLMIAATRTSGANNYKILRNGANVIASSGSYTPTLYTASADATIYSSIGNRVFNPVSNTWINSEGAWFSGSLSSIMMYNRVLSDDELNQIYNTGRAGIFL